MAKNSIKKYIIPVVMILLIVFTYYQYHEVRLLKDDIRSAGFNLSRYLGNRSITYLADKLEKQQSSENLMAFYIATMYQVDILEGLIEMNRSNINKELWQGYLAKSYNQANAFVLELALKDEVSQEELNKLVRILEAWKKFEGKTEREYIWGNSIEGLTQGYIKLYSDLATIAPNEISK